MNYRALGRTGLVVSEVGFGAWGIGERVQLELAGDLSTAFGGSGTLVLGGGTVRGLFRF